MRTLTAVAAFTCVAFCVQANLVFHPSAPPTFLAPVQTADSGDVSVGFPDHALRRCVIDALGKHEAELITRQELATLRNLHCESNGIRQLSGIEYAENLRSLDLPGNQISDLRPLAQLTSLELLSLAGNRVIDLTPLGGLTRLRNLTLAGNDIADFTPLADMWVLEVLHAADNLVSDLTPLRGVTELTELYLSDNWFSDLTPLQGLTKLETLSLRRNQVSVLTALVSNRGLDQGDRVFLDRNPLSYEAVNVDVMKLRDRGVEVSMTSAEPMPDNATIVEFSDQALEHAIRQILGKGNGWPITANELGRFQGLALAGLGIEDLTGLEFAAGLRRLDLSHNRVTSLAPLANLASLEALWLTGNPVSDLSPIVSLTSIQSLILNNTEIVDLAPLAGRPSLFSLALDGNSIRDISLLKGNFNLNHLSLSDNEISDIDALANMRYLQWISLDGNAISSVEPLAGLRNLRHLNVSANQIEDLSPLEGHPSLEELLVLNNHVGDLSLRGGKLAFLGLQGNPLGSDAIPHARELRGAGTTVLLGHVVPYFPAGGGSREGFVRVINRSDDGGNVFIEAVDDEGERVGPVRLALGPQQARHINSGDLERGNPGKGLSGGTGPPRQGDWRLVVTSPLDIEVLSYVRTADGFVTAMHDMAESSVLPFFNPGANTSQRSILRVVNTETGAARWLTGGYDDIGAWWAMPNAVLVQPGHSFTTTAQELEETHGLGNGVGKWRLQVPRWPWLAMSLLESPTGHLSNLSTAQANVERLADGSARHRVPLFLASGGPREGFARVVNRSWQSGEVAIEGIDDAGNRRGPVRLNIPGRKTVHFNSRDLEPGNAAKGLSGGLSAGYGDWRLTLTTALDIQVLAYVRTANGFVTTMHDLAPTAEDGAYRVVFFNPGSNTAQVSKLRLMNDGDEAAQVTITGIDDEGTPSGTVGLTLAGRRALTLSAAQLETGGEGISGRLGDGMGKWRLRVYSDTPLAVMSLLESPTGHLTNLSTATAGRSPWPRRGEEQRERVQSLDFDRRRD